MTDVEILHAVAAEIDRRRWHEVEQHLAARTDDAVRDDPDAGLPATDRGIEVGVDRRALRGERRMERGIRAEGLRERETQCIDGGAGTSDGHQDHRVSFTVAGGD